MINQGTTLECFLDLIERLRPDLYEKRRILAPILGVEETTIRRWATGEGKPVGMTLNTLRYYLDYLGYQLIELSQIPDLYKDASRLLAFQVLTLEEMSKLTGHETYPAHLLAVLRGKRGVSPEREDQLREVVMVYREELMEKKRSTPKLVVVEHTSRGVQSLPVSLQTAVLEAVRPVVNVPVPPKDSLSRDERFRTLTENLLDFAKYYTSPGVSDADRDRLRAVVGQEKIFDLKNLLSRLCGSKAFSNQQ